MPKPGAREVPSMASALPAKPNFGARLDASSRHD
jgi:hypothetical protein